METDELLNEAMVNAPSCWDQDEAMSNLLIQYIRRLEEGNNHAVWCDGDCDD